MKLIYSTLSFLFLSIVYSQQQTSNYVNLPVTPEAAALAKMVNYPINYNTGVPNINIPFYEISVGSLKLPITLNYHAGGFKINEQATRTGLGWSLSCDLQITRSISGKDDLAPGGYISNNLVTDASNPYPFYTTPYPYNSTSGYENTYYMANGEKDGMPDKFNYQLLNKTGSFYFQKNSEGSGYSIVPVPYDNIKITYDASSGTFKIVDTDGSTYYFGVAGVLDLDYLHLRKKEVTNNTITSWKCDKVISNNKIDQIVFSYNKKTNVTQISYNDKIEYYNNSSPPCEQTSVYYTAKSQLIVNKTDYNDVINTVPFYELSYPKYMNYFWNKSEFHLPYLDNQNNIVDKIYLKNDTSSSSRSDIYGVSLSEISFRGGRVLFSGADELSLIQVLDDKNSEVKSLQLFPNKKISYLNGIATKGTRYLDSLYVKNAANTFERYALLYDKKLDYGNHLKGHDAWGYPNYKTRPLDRDYNDFLAIRQKKIVQDRFYKSFDCFAGITSDYVTNKEITIGGDDNWSEQANEDDIRQGILKQIIYPTGGSVKFDFESNKYQELFVSSDYGQKLPQIGGGLRIRSISYFDKNSEFANQKYFRYGELEEGTGIPMSRPRQDPKPLTYYFDVESYDQEIDYLRGGNNLSPITTEIKTTYSSVSSLDYTYPSGAPIYYTKVTEYQQDLGQQTGKTVYSYYKPEEFYSVLSPFINDRNLVPGTNIPYLKTDWMMGAQKSIETYKISNSGYKSIYKKSFEYSRYDRPNQVKVAYAFFKKIRNVIGSFAGSQIDLYNNSNNFIVGEYGLPMGKLLLAKEKEEWFEDLGSKSVSTSYFYDKLPFVQASRIQTTNSKDENIETQYKYAYDFDGVYDEMESENMISPLVEEIKTNVTLSKELSRKKINFEKTSGTTGFFVPKTIQNSVKGQSLQTDITINKYDSYANVLQLTGRDNVSTSYLWGYNNLYLVAELKNVLYDAIPSTYTSNSIISNPASDSALNSLTAGLRTTFNNLNQKVTTYTYKRQVGVTSTTDAKGYTQYYNYDPIGRLKTVTDKDQKILKGYDYYINKFKVVDDNRYYSFPIMRSINFDCSSGFIQNYIVPGGKYFFSSSDHDTANGIAEYEMISAASSAAYPFVYDCSTSEKPTANLELTANFFNLNEQVPNFPVYLEVDFIQEGSIIATQKFNINTNYQLSPIPSKLFLLQGTYQLSFRMNSNVRYSQGYIPDYSITTIEDNNKQYIVSGNSFYFGGGKHYKLEVVNWR